MNDFEKLKTCLKEIGIGFTEAIENGIKTAEFGGELNYNQTIKLGNGIGYFSSYCTFYFLDGKCNGHGCWE
jgi:hypothetical protein